MNARYDAYVGDAKVGGRATPTRERETQRGFGLRQNHERAQRIRSTRTAISVVVLGLLVTGVTTPAAAGDRDPEVFPAYHNDRVVHVMMGPGGNSENPHQRPSPPQCGWGLGPNYSGTGRDASRLPKMYVLRVPGATQMLCAAETADPPPNPPPDPPFSHDMVLESAPGERGYNASVHLVACFKAGTFDANTDMPIKSAGAVNAAVQAGKLNCTPTGRIASSPVVGR